MSNKRLIPFVAFLVLICGYVSAAALAEDPEPLPDTRQGAVVTHRLTGMSIICPPATDPTRRAVQPSDLDEYGLQVLSIASVLQSYCEAFRQQNGRMPETLAELRGSGWFLFYPIPQSYSPGLKLSDADVEIKLRQLTPREHDGGAAIVRAVDWGNTRIPGLIQLAGETTAAQLTADIQSWNTLHIDFTPTGILLAGYNVEASEAEIPASWGLLSPRSESSSQPDRRAGIESTGLAAVVSLQSRSPGAPDDSFSIDNYGTLYTLTKGQACEIRTAEGETDEEPVLLVTPWVLRITEEVGERESLSPLAGADTNLLPGRSLGDSLRESQPPASLPPGIRVSLMMELRGHFLDSYVTRHQALPQDSTELLDGMWGINESALDAFAAVAPGDAGGGRMAIIIVERPSEGAPGTAGGDEMIVIINNMPVAVKTVHEAYFEITPEPGSTRLFRKTLSEEGFTHGWEQVVSNDRFIIDDNNVPNAVFIIDDNNVALNDQVLTDDNCIVIIQ